MRQYLLLLCGSLLFTGCFRVVTTDQVHVVEQSIADSSAALSYIDNMATDSQQQGILLATNAIRKHGENIALAVEIKPEDLPSARVNKNDWLVDPTKAHSQSLQNAQTDSQSLERYAMWGLSALTIGAVGVRLGAALLAAHPLGGVLGQLGTLFGYNSPVKDKVHNKFLRVLEDYKKVDPKWDENPLYTMLSDRMTQAEKDYIKEQRHALS